MIAQLTQLQTDARQERGRAIAESQSQITCVEENFYTVKSQSGNGEYVVCKVNGEWVCECPDNKYRNVKCKHIYALEVSLKIKGGGKEKRQYSRSCYFKMHFLPFTKPQKVRYST